MNALPCPSDVGQRLLDEMVDEESRKEVRERDLEDMAESSYWLRKWGRDDDSGDAVEACTSLATLFLERGLPSSCCTEREDWLRDAYDSLQLDLRRCFDRWATAGKPSHLDRYQEAERLAREADRAEGIA
jgi:hypothetical protein